MAIDSEILNYFSLGQRIQILRRDCGIRQYDLANKVGVRDTYISQVENNRITPADDVLERIASELGVHRAELAGDSS